MARNYEVKYGTIKNNLLKDINKKRKDYIDLESPIIQRFGGDIWATGIASMAYVIPENEFDLPYEIKEDRAMEMKSIYLKDSNGKIKDTVKVYFIKELLQRFYKDTNKLELLNDGTKHGVTHIYRNNILVGVLAPFMKD